MKEDKREGEGRKKENSARFVFLVRTIVSLFGNFFLPQLNQVLYPNSTAFVANGFLVDDVLLEN